jgi:hypothetical protein
VSCSGMQHRHRFRHPIESHARRGRFAPRRCARSPAPASHFLDRRCSASIPRVWADTLLHAEQQHLLRLLFWAGLSILGATGVATMMAVRRVRSPFLAHFAIQMAAWGVAIGVIGAIGWFNAHLRDVSGAARLERLLWMNIGLDAGYVAVGVVLSFAAWRFARKIAPVGAGVAIVVQGLALLLIDLQFASVISR